MRKSDTWQWWSLNVSHKIEFVSRAFHGKPIIIIIEKSAHTRSWRGIPLLFVFPIFSPPNSFFFLHRPQTLLSAFFFLRRIRKLVFFSTPASIVLGESLRVSFSTFFLSFSAARVFSFCFFLLTNPKSSGLLVIFSGRWKL